jgi:hypothetical protein
MNLTTYLHAGLLIVSEALLVSTFLLSLTFLI